MRRYARFAAPLLGAGLLVAFALWFSQTPQGPATAYAGPGDASNFFIVNDIDKHVLARLVAEKVEPSAACSDEEFIRRVYLDVVGMIPTGAETKQFLKDRSGDKRAKLIDKLLQDERFGNHWAVLWGDLLREHSNSRPQEGTVRGSYREWLRDQLNANLPYDRFVMELVTATGQAETNAAVNFYLRDEGDRIETVNTVAGVFMGTRMACAQCHDHPFDSWEQKDFHSLMAFFAPRTMVTTDPVATMANMRNAKGLRKEIMELLEPEIKEAEAEMAERAKRTEMAGKQAELPSGTGMGMRKQMAKGPRGGELRKIVKEVEEKYGAKTVQALQGALRRAVVKQVSEKTSGDYLMPEEGDSQDQRTKKGELVAPTSPWNKERKIPGSEVSRREALVLFMVESRRFAEVQANRLWAQVMGRGLVDPVDDFRPKNPATHPEVLKYLADEFVNSKFDSKHVLKLILNSSTYQRTSMPTANNRTDKELYSHHRVRRMTAEQLFDSILVATGRDEGLTEMGRGTVQALGGGRNARGGNNRKVQWAFDMATPAPEGSFLSTFNQSDRQQLEVARDESGSITQAMELLNGQSINGAVLVRPGSLSHQLLEAKLPGDTVAKELYLAAFSRYPTADELRVAGIVLKGAPPAKEMVEDFHWALLNSREFLFIK